ncbi:MAG: cyclic nucleotide-binding domain-containing protein, partial [Flavisolibacter sp.]
MNINLLKNIPLFSSLDNDSLSELAGYLEKHTYPPFHTIFWMNERGENLYIIQSGRVAISYTDEQGREIELNTLRQGSFFGELSLIDGGPHTATARTIGETVLLTLDRATFYHFL